MRPSLLLMLIVLSQPALADWYQVEVIVFRNINADADGEFWSQNPGLPGREESIQLLEYQAEGLAGVPAVAGVEPVPYLELPEARYRLDGVEHALKLSPEYRPLLHVAWQQPARGTDRSRAVHLDFPPLPEAPVVADGSAAVTEVPDPVLDGTVRLRVGRFLHVDVDMVYFPDQMPALPGSAAPAPAPAADHSIRLPEALPADYVRLRHTRKILLNELHYIDHPLFGLVLQVTRIQTPDPAATPQAGL